MTPEENRVFDEIVSQIDLKPSWRTRRMSNVYTMRKLAGVMIALAGLGILIAGVETKNTIIGLVGWLIGLAAITWIVADKTRKVNIEHDIFENPFVNKDNGENH